MFMNMYVHGYVYVYDSICWALKCPVHCAEPFLELKICISPQFRAIDPPNPARGFIQQNENVRFATAACMQKYGNVSFATVACAKCMRYGGRGGTHTMGGGGGWQHGTRNHIYIYIYYIQWYDLEAEWTCERKLDDLMIGWVENERNATCHTLGCLPQDASGKWRFRVGSPTKNIWIRVVTRILGRGKSNPSCMSNVEV